MFFLISYKVFIVSINCERDLSDDATRATYSKTAEVFTDDFVEMGTDFYFPYGDSKFTAFSVDRSQGYNSNASIRIDVPNDALSENFMFVTCNQETKGLRSNFFYQE